MQNNLAYKYLYNNKELIQSELKKIIKQKNIIPVISINSNCKRNIKNILSVVINENIPNVIKISEIKKEICKRNLNVHTEWSLMNEELILLNFSQK